MPGPDFLIPLAAVRQAAADHQAGWSLRALARLRYREWGYKTPDSAQQGLRCAMHTLDLPVRDQRAATADATTVHGLASGGAHEPSHPDHQQFLAYRRQLRRVVRERTAV